MDEVYVVMDEANCSVDVFKSFPAAKYFVADSLNEGRLADIGHLLRECTELKAANELLLDVEISIRLKRVNS